MAHNKNVIELNGIRYDALTGAVLGSKQPAERRVQPMQVRQHPKPAERTVHQRALHPRQQAAHNAHSHSTPSMDGIVHTRKPNLHLTAHQPQPTKTLMRRAVKAPQTATAKPAVKVAAPLKHGIPANAVMQSRLAVRHVDSLRAGRASSTPRSAAVKHFTPATSAFQPHSYQAFQPQPATTAAPATQALQPAKLQQFAQPAMTNRQRVAARQAPATAQAPAQAVLNQMRADAQDRDDNDMFAKALAHAVSHEEQAPRESLTQSTKRRGKKYRKVLGFTASAAVFLALCGFVAYQNKTNIQLQLASAKAGFSASIPLYKPAGYSLGALKYGTGAVAVSYNGHGNSFNITQKKSNWDSQTLLENFVATSNESYQGYQAGGRTIYVYGKGKATWVNGGIWYQISGADKLSDEQIVKVAASM